MDIERISTQTFESFKFTSLNVNLQFYLFGFLNDYDIIHFCLITKPMRRIMSLYFQFDLNKVKQISKYYLQLNHMRTFSKGEDYVNYVFSENIFQLYKNINDETKYQAIACFLNQRNMK